MAEATYQDPNQVFSEIINRMRALESKYNLLGERLLVVNQNMISEFKKNSTEFRATNDDLKEIRTELFKTKETIKDLSRELKFFATKEHIKALEKYIKIWDPMKFITQEDLDKFLERGGLVKKKKDGRT
ncbi:MAG: hypothetical protein ABIB47_05910 [Candidatus Woesearchaeota archaeon]